MITLVLTNRNRDLRIVKNCLDSLTKQIEKSFELVLIDYGSKDDYISLLKGIAKKYKFLQLILCPVAGQLWNKSRAINIALKETTTRYFIVGDIDLMFSPDFIKIAKSKASQKVLYFKCGFLSKEQSLREMDFADYQVDFYGSEDVTGIALFPTDILKSVNGYDEFYHGWGAEDTDIQLRLKNIGLRIEFYKEHTLVKHQWHPKAYRSKHSSSPYHSNLERINHSYMNMTQSYNRIKANIDAEWGKVPTENEYNKLRQIPDHTIIINPIDFEFSSLLAQFKNFKNELVKIKIKCVSNKEIQKQALKRVLHKKYNNYLNLETINNLLLEEIIKNYRNSPYSYSFNRQKGEINFIILFS